MSKITEQFKRGKKAFPGTVLFFRIGDFYELFYEDATLASNALGLTLTTREKGSDCYNRNQNAGI